MLKDQSPTLRYISLKKGDLCKETSKTQACTECIDGQYQNQNEAAPALCKTCSGGQYSPAKETVCGNCEAGKFQELSQSIEYNCITVYRVPILILVDR